MKEYSQNIDKIFLEAFENYHYEVAEEEWKHLAPAVRLQNFLKFGFKHFNIYYTALLIAITGVGIYYVSNNRNQEIIFKNEIPVIKNSSPSPSVTVMPNNESEITEKNIDTKLNKIPDSELSKHAPINNQACTHLVEDTSAINNENIDNLFSDDPKLDSITTINNNQTSLKRGKKKIHKITIAIKNPVVLNDTVVAFTRD